MDTKPADAPELVRDVDLETWPRRAHYAFFRAFDLPFWNVTADVDVSRLHVQPTFTIAAFYHALVAINRVEVFRMRIRGERVVVLPRVHGGTTVLRPDDTFGFGYFDFDPDPERFAAGARRGLEQARADRRFEPSGERDDLVHFSVLPWIAFTSFQHARNLGTGDAIPKLVFGKHRDVGGRRMMPVSVEVHHALVDGLHVGRFFEHFQASIDSAAPDAVD